MSNVSTTQESRDVYAISQQNMNKFFAECEKSISQYRQSVDDFQHECLESCKKFAESSIAVQKEYANTSQVNIDVPEAAQKVASDIMASAEKTFAVQNKWAQTAMNTAINNIKAINSNAKSFAELNQSIAKSWIPAWPQTKQQ